ncbi:hypothetical protein BDN71DRAFT_1436905 [Pleurotus eryngii]|uniref:Uncharacterized protein n=1 Tax=Pleurotus eryngii TaxID=5323 RepID=A0A9P5ZIR8_PLEER|nr:hypothetical protein BDN71DRAFT_1436905 [Pleurotus eryngii]
MTKMLRGLMLPREAGIALSTAISQILQSDPHQETSSETLRLERFLRSLTSIYASLGRDNPYDALLGHRFSRETYLFGSGGPWISNIVSSDIPLNVKLSLMAKPCAYILRSRRSKGNLPLQEAIFLGILEPQPGTLLLPQDLWNALQEISGSLYFPEVSQQMLVKLYRKAFESGSASSVKRDGKFVVERTSAPRDFMRELAIQFAYRQVFHEKDEVREWTVEANLKALLFIGKDLQTSRMASHYCSGYMIDAWDFTVSRCVDIVGTDGTITVPPDLSESLSNDAASILSDYELLSNPGKLLKAVWKLNHEFEFLTYQELFQDFENLPDDVPYIWTFALRENREPAYACFIKLDILSHLSSQYYEHMLMPNHHLLRNPCMTTFEMSSGSSMNALKPTREPNRVANRSAASDFCIESGAACLEMVSRRLSLTWSRARANENPYRVCMHICKMESSDGIREILAMGNSTSRDAAGPKGLHLAWSLSLDRRIGQATEARPQVATNSTMEFLVMNQHNTFVRRRGLGFITSMSGVMFYGSIGVYAFIALRIPAMISQYLAPAGHPRRWKRRSERDMSVPICKAPHLQSMPVPTRTTVPLGGIKSYYQAKIEVAKLTINQKTQSLPQLEVP